MLNWRRVLSVDEEISARYSYVIDKSDDFFMFPLAKQKKYIPLNFSGDEGIRHELELQHFFRLNSQARVSWGGSWRDDGVRAGVLLVGQGEVHRDVRRVFGNFEWKPSERLTVNLGAAEESDSMAGSHFAPRGSVNLHLDQQNTLRFGVSRAYHTGSIVNYRADTSPIQAYVKATPGLLPERLDTIELGYLGDWRDWRSSLDVRVFHERVAERFFRVALDNYPKTTIPIQDVAISGVEYQFKWQPLEGTRVALAQAFARISSETLDSAEAFITAKGGTGAADQMANLQRFTENSMPRQATSLLLAQKLPYGLEFSAAAYWQSTMKWSTNSLSKKYHRVDARLGYPFRMGTYGGELALTVQSLNGDHNEYKSVSNPADSDSVNDRVVSRREWVTLRLDF